MDELFVVGAAETDITPPIGLAMDGYMAREGGSTGIHDPLRAQVLVLDHHGQRAVIVALDVLGVSLSFSDRLRHALAAQIGASPDAVLIAASHTHAGPTGVQTWFPVDAAPQLDSGVTELIGERVMTAAREALTQLQPARLRAASGSAAGLGGDRNRPDQPVDTQVTTLSFHDASGAPIAVLLHYACHPTVLSAANRLYSADFPGAAREQLQAAFPGVVALYLNGAAGNISTRFHRHDQSFAEVDRLGGILAEQARALIVSATAEPATLGLARETITLPFRAFAAETRALAGTGNARLDTVRAEGAHIEAKLRQALHGRTGQTSALSALRVGRWRLLAVPGEAFSDLALALRADDPYALVVGYANDYAGYFPTQAAIDDATYEALSSPYDARATALLYQRLRAMPAPG